VSGVLALEVVRIGAGRIAEVRLAAGPTVHAEAAHLIEAEAGNAEALTAIVAAHAAGRRAGDAVVLPTGNATGREWPERPFPPGWWMGGSNCRGDV
jgi:hypothetical protein